MKLTIIHALEDGMLIALKKQSEKELGVSKK
jgi:hypothetical protein